MNFQDVCAVVFLISLCFINTNQAKSSTSKKGSHHHHHHNHKSSKRRHQIAHGNAYTRNSMYLDQQIKILQDLLAKLQKYRDMKNCSFSQTPEDKVRVENVQAHLQKAQVHAQKAINGVIMGKLYGQAGPHKMGDASESEGKIGNVTQTGNLNINAQNPGQLPNDFLKIANSEMSKPLIADQHNDSPVHGPIDMTKISPQIQNAKEPLILNNVSTNGMKPNLNEMKPNLKGTGVFAQLANQSQLDSQTPSLNNADKSVGLVGNVTLKNEVISCKDYEKFAKANQTMKRSLAQGSCYCPACCMTCCPKVQCPLSPPGACSCPRSPDQCRCEAKSTAYNFPAIARPNPHGLSPDLPIETNAAEHVAPTYLVHDDVNTGPSSFIHPDNHADSPFLPHNGPKPFAPDHPELFGLNPDQAPHTPDFFGDGANHMQRPNPNPFTGPMVGDSVVGPYGDGMGGNTPSSNKFAGDFLHGQFLDEMGSPGPSFSNGMAFMYPSEKETESNGGLLGKTTTVEHKHEQKKEHGELNARVFIAQCKDSDTECYYWAVNGYCENPAPFISVHEVRKKCMLACGECQRLDQEAGTTLTSIISSHLRRSALHHHGKHKSTKHKNHAHKHKNKH